MKLYKINQASYNNYENHQMLKEMFEGNGNVLYQNNGTSLTVLSNIELNPAYRNHIGIECVDSIRNILTKRDSFAFSIRLNCAKHVKGKHVGVLKDDMDDWICSKLSDIGAEITSKSFNVEGNIQSVRKGINVTHSSVLVFGMLAIIDQDKFEETLTNGIGRAKAFGFGMLNIF
jgi:CRISPR system Cascade subunit CasE